MANSLSLGDTVAFTMEDSCRLPPQHAFIQSVADSSHRLRNSAQIKASSLKFPSSSVIVHEEAHSQFNNARAVFKSIAVQPGAAKCLLESLRALLMAQPTGWEAITQDLIDEAELEYKTLNDHVGIAQLDIVKADRDGVVGNNLGRLKRAQDALTSGNLEDQSLYVAEAHYLMARSHFALRQYLDGFSSGEVALQIYEKLGNYGEFDADTMRSLGDACIDIQEYSKAKNLLTRALTRYIEVGSPAGAARCWFGLGRIWLKTGQMDDAREAIQNSLAS